MRWCLLLLGAFLVLAPAGAEAETCTFNAGASRWTAVGTVSGAGTTGCTASNDDTFVIPSGADVVIDGTVTVTTGQVQVTGGNLRVTCGFTFSPGASLNVTGGTFQPEGCVLWEGRMNSISWGNFATGATVTLPQDVSSIASASTDFLVYGDDDPVSSTISEPVQTVAGLPDPTKFRPSFNKWAWYKLTSVSGKTVTYLYDTWSTSGGTGTPYAGTRGPIAPSDIAVSAITRVSYGFASDLTVPTGTLTGTNDGGSQYVEVTSGTCSGKMAKIVYSTDGGAGTDTITVAGDLTNCGTPNVKVHYGARAGDLVRIIRPAVISGTVSGTNTTVVNWTSGYVKSRWALWDRLGAQTYTPPTPDISMACDFCIYEQSSGVGPSAGSYLVDTAFKHGELNSTEDTATILFSGWDATNGTARYSGSYLNMAGIDFRRIYIADARETSSGNGVHGFVLEAVGGLTIDKFRIERMSDDAVVAVQRNYLGAAGQGVLTYALKNGLIYEDFTNTNSSQECYEDNVGDIGTGSTHSILLNRGTAQVSDLVAIGCNDHTLRANVLGGNFLRVVLGGAGYSASGGETIIGAFQSGYTNLTSYTYDYPNTLSDSIVYSYGPSTSAARTVLNATVTGSIVMHPSGSNGDIYEMAASAGSFFDENAGYSGAPYFILAYGTTKAMQKQAVSWEDSVFAMTNATNFCDNFGNYEDLLTATIRRVFMAVDNGANPGFLSANCFNVDQVPADSATVDGAFMTSTNASSRGLGATTPLTNGARMTNTCMATTYARDSANACGTSATSSCFTFSSLAPKAGQYGTMRQFVQRGDLNDVCDQGKPSNLGWRTLGVAHAALGDFVMDQLGNFSTWSLGTGVKPKPVRP